MEDIPPSQTAKTREKKKSNIAKIIFSLFLFALGLTSISIGNLITIHTPYFFGIDYTIYSIIQVISTPLGYFLMVLALILFIYPLFINLTSFRVGLTNPSFEPENIQALRDKAEKHPDKIEPIWDLGRGNLQNYFNSNLSQNSNIYRISVASMIAGFVLIIFAIIAGFISHAAFAPALIGAIAGTITEFIGATFLLMYRATIQQASDYMKTIERINRVGMATKILDTMSDESIELRDETKATLVKLLFSQDLAEQEDIKDNSTKNRRRAFEKKTETEQAE